MNAGKPIASLDFHPTERQWVLASAWEECQDFNEDEECFVNRELYLSTDLGDSWDFL